MGYLEIAADYDFLEECIIFGFHLMGEIFEVLNFCILIAKYYIHNTFHEIKLFIIKK